MITFVDITELRHAQERSHWLAAIVDSSEDAIVGMDLKGKISSWNEAAEKLYGYSEQEVIARPYKMLLPPGMDIEPIFEQSRKGKSVRAIETARTHQNGSSLDLQISFSPVLDSEGALVGIASISHDVSERKRQEEALREADKRKNEFMAMLSHELRNPMVPVRNAVWVMKKNVKERSSPELFHAVQLMGRQIDHLSHLIDDLLDVTRITSGKVVIEKIVFDLGRLCRNIVDDLLPVAAENKIALKADLPDEVIVVKGDVTRLVQAIGNLIRNAIKFSDAGGEVHVKLAVKGEEAMLRIRDQGVGIDGQTCKRMFEPFMQGRTTSECGGFGLGLSLAKRMVELHGGSLTGESAGPGRGAVFTVCLPIWREPLSEQPMKDERVTQEGPSEEKKRWLLQVLLIEDDYDVADGMSMLLEDEGCSVSIAASGEEGVRMAKTDKPDVVLCDIGLPGKMNGYDVAEALRKDPETAGLYCIALSGYGQKEDKRRALQAGFDAHLTKPADPDELLRLLTSAPERPRA